MNRRKGVDDSSDDEQGDLNSTVQDQSGSTPPHQSESPHQEPGDNRNGDGSGSESEPGDDADSSDESSDDDEEEIAKLRDEFIADSDAGSESGSDGHKRKRRRKRRRRPVDEPVQLDEDDLDLLGVNTPSASSGGRFKRLKKVNRDAGERKSGLDAMFDDTERRRDEETDRAQTGEFDDFIEADEFSEDDDEQLRRQEEREIGRKKHSNRSNLNSTIRNGLGLSGGDLAGLDEEKLSEIYDVFGDGEMYDWALANEDDEEDKPEEPVEGMGELQLTDVFEPSELAVRMLTAEDNAIRSEDLPERYQILRQRVVSGSYELSDTEFFEKKQWIIEQVLKVKSPEFEMLSATRTAIGYVVECIARESLEVPFIWHHRQDYLVHFSSVGSDAVRTQLLELNDLWSIVDFDIDFHAILERRTAAMKLIQAAHLTPEDEPSADQSRVSKLLDRASSTVEFQDIVEFVQFLASAQLRAARRHSRFAGIDRTRQNEAAMAVIKSANISPEAVYQQLEAGGLSPDSVGLETSYSDPVEGPGDVSLPSVVDFLAHEIGLNPAIRQFFRLAFEQHAKVDLVLTDDGRKRITSNSPFADLKYSCNWTLPDLQTRPTLFLRMLEAESQGLIIVRAQYPQYKSTLYHRFEQAVAGEGQADWVSLRREVAKAASRIIVPGIARNVLESLKHAALRSLRFEVRTAFANRLNQAPFKPAGYVLGTVPRVMCVSAGEATVSDAVLCCCVDEDGHVSQVVKLGDSRAADFGSKLADVAKEARPDVVAVCGFTPAARRLFANVQQSLEKAQVVTGPEDAEQPVQAIWVLDEVARLYRHSSRAAQEFPELVPNARYCVGVARYVQSPLLEYAQLDDAQLRNLAVTKSQHLLPPDQFAWAVESAFVDAVCTVGVDLNLAVRSQYHAQLLRFVAGLGPRKAGGMVQSVLARAEGGRVELRTQLVTAEITPRVVFMNCASFLRISFESKAGGTGDYLDSTRIHPEDYELARKMCADALELDEEDIESVEERTPGGVVGQLVSSESELRKLDELVLEEYAEELEQLFKQKKRVTLVQIRREIEDPYLEQRDPLHPLSTDDVFTMLTGATRQTFHSNSVVSATVKRVTGRQLVLSLDGGIDGVAESGSISDDRSVPLGQQFAPGQAISCVVEQVDYPALYAKVDARASAVQRQLQSPESQVSPELAAARADSQHWNAKAELRDEELVLRRNQQRERQMRVIKHPLFRPFSAREAEAFLAPLQRGDLVIRPSSRGLDHLVVTWKVADQIYQHVDVLELDKPNDYALGKTLCVGNYRYHDLDELIIMHIQSMSRKVDEMTNSEKFQQGNRKDVEKWLSAYTNARPTQSVYAFCFDHRRPGYFLLCYMLGANQPIMDCHVKVLPNGYEFMRNAYPDVQSVTNGFKMMISRN